jgi:hypothetical protein
VKANESSRARAYQVATGNVTVVNVCQFEKTALAVMVSFEPENKIAGMNITPVTAPAEPSATPVLTRFTEESVNVGVGEWALPGTLSMPVGPVAAAIVLVHGSGPNDRDETLGPNKPRAHPSLGACSFTRRHRGE